MKTTERVMISDMLGEAMSYLHAIRLASNGLKRTDDIAALDLLATKALEEVVKALGVVDNVEEVAG